MDLDSRPTLTKALEGNLPSALADMASYLADLNAARWALWEMDNHQDQEMLQALWECAVVRYTRVFQKGVRSRRTPLNWKRIESVLTDAQLAQHREVLNVRDKHVAHSVNHDEQPKAVIFLADTEDGSEREFLAVGSAVYNRRVFHAGAADPFVDLVEEVRSIIVAQYRLLRVEIEEHVRKMDLDDLYEGRDLYFDGLEDRDPGKSRKH
ncbi:hypothetical protein [Demequina salsinemoris]|uniref:hypothetical protein n=1 Tax=Demequina salsinemoris TaxID=577470 RepID=UPI000782DD04|nr:hypothetical protein [Demequina salsinemoris]